VAEPEKIAEEIGRLVEDFDRAVQDSIDNPSSMAAAYVQIRLAEDELGAAMKRLANLSDALQYTKLPEAFQAAGVTSLTVTGYRVTAMPLVRASITPGQKEPAFQWLRDNDFGSLVIETVNAGSLASLAKSMVQDEGRELPEGLFNVHHGTTMSVTKAK
jgi:hypothetical protein